MRPLGLWPWVGGRVSWWWWSLIRIGPQGISIDSSVVVRRCRKTRVLQLPESNFDSGHRHGQKIPIGNRSEQCLSTNFNTYMNYLAIGAVATFCFLLVSCGGAQPNDTTGNEVGQAKQLLDAPAMGPELIDALIAELGVPDKTVKEDTTMAVNYSWASSAPTFRTRAVRVFYTFFNDLPVRSATEKHGPSTTITSTWETATMLVDCSLTAQNDSGVMHSYFQVRILKK